jgi:hypothetical protein
MRRAGAAIAAVAFVGVGTVAVLWGPDLFSNDAPTPERERCYVTVDQALTYELPLDSANNAALISGVAFQRGYGLNGMTVGLATAIQESGLRNLDWGDRDSLGLFQQRPSQGWGSPEEIQDPYYSTNTFYAALEKVDGWETMRVTDAAQAVQRSGYPEAYGDHEEEARAWARAFTGDADAVVTCAVNTAEPRTAEAFAARVRADLGPSYSVEVLGQSETSMELGVRPLDDSDESVRALQAWAIATASKTSVAWVDRAGVRWDRSGSWRTETPPEQFADYRGIRVSVTTG